MDSDLPHHGHTPGKRSLSFPRSCSLDTASGSDDCGESLSGRNFPSTGTIPILLADDDGDDIDDTGDLLESDPASLPPRFEPCSDTEEFGSSSAGCRAAQDVSSDVLGMAESPAVRGSSRTQSARGGNGLNRFSAPHRPIHIPFNPAHSDPSSWPAGGRNPDSPPSRPHCHCSPYSYRSSPPDCLGPATALYTPDSQPMERSCHGSCGASPAAITSTQLIAAKKHERDFALENYDPQISQPFSNSISLHDCMQQVRLPLTLNHDHDHHIRSQRSAPHIPSSPAPSSTDLTIEFPPRDQAMDRDLPPPYSPTIGSSSSSSSSNLGLPHHLAWLQFVTISLSIDQEGFRAVSPTFQLVGYTKPALPIHTSRAQMQKLFAGGHNGDVGSTSVKQVSGLVGQASTDSDLVVNLDGGMAEFMPLMRESFVFHHSALDTPPSLRRLSVNGDESRDYLSKLAYLGIKSSGGFQVYAVCGSEVRRGSGGEDPAARSEGGVSPSPIKLEWRFEYAVEDKRKADGTKAGGGEKSLTPLRFSCSPGLLHPKQGHKVTVLSVWKKSIQPKLVASKVEPPIITGDRSHKLSGPASPPTSPRNAGPLRFPTVTKLWGKWTKSSPYRFEKGSDGSEEELIPSEDSTNRRRRPRAASTSISRVSQEEEWPLERWDGDRGQSMGAVRPACRDARPSIAGGERSRGRARSEGEDERVSSHSQAGHLVSRPVRRRPRTANR